MLANSLVKKGKLAKYQVAQSPIHGNGLFAVIRFRKGDRILQFDDTRVITDEHPLQPEEGESPLHLDSLQGGKVVVMQDPECFINHSCDPNTYYHTEGHWRYLLARRDIQAGDEITCDYAINGDNEGTWKCNCGVPRCRGTVHGDFFQLPREIQIEYLPLLDCWFVDEHSEQLALIENLS